MPFERVCHRVFHKPHEKSEKSRKFSTYSASSAKHTQYMPIFVAAQKSRRRLTSRKIASFRQPLAQYGKLHILQIGRTPLRARIFRKGNVTMYTEMNNFARCRVSDRGACRGNSCRGGMSTPEPRREMQEQGGCHQNDGCNHNNGCAQNDGCGTGSRWGLVGYPLASVYAPLQEWCELYDEERALKAGTIFAQLDLPFVCGRAGKGGCGCD